MIYHHNHNCYNASQQQAVDEVSNIFARFSVSVLVVLVLSKNNFIIDPFFYSYLLSTLTWPSLLFLSSLFLPRTPTQTTSVLKFFFPTSLPYNSLTSTALLSEALLLIPAPGPSLLISLQTSLTLLSLKTSMLTTQPGTNSFPLTRPEMTCFAGSLLLV